LKLNPADVAKVELSLPRDSGTMISATRVKKEDEFTTDKAPEGQKLKSDVITRFLGSFASLNFSDTTELTDPQVAIAKAHARTLKLTLFDGKTVTIVLGRKPEEKIVKPLSPDAAKNGPVALLDVNKATLGQPKPAGDNSPTGGTAKPLEAATETVPAGPVFIFITDSDPKAPVNALMQRRAFNVSDYIFTGLPQNSYEIFDSVAPANKAKPAEKTPPPAVRP